MQSVNHPIYTYDATGRLINYTPSGSSNDIVADHILLDPRTTAPRSLASAGLLPPQFVNNSQFLNSTPLLENSLLNGYQPPILNSPSLFIPPLSMTSPPVIREKTIATDTGYSSFSENPELKDVNHISSGIPVLSNIRKVENLSRRNITPNGGM